MASDKDVQQLRRMINEKDQCDYTDQTLKDRIDEVKDLNQLAYDIWIEKASKFSTMVDVSESGSSRKMSDLYDNALNQAKFFKSVVTDASAPTTVAPFTVQAERA